MDALIERHTDHILSAAQIAEDPSIPVEERMLRTVMALHVEEEDGTSGKEMIEHLHKPQNALMHQKTKRIIMQRVPPMLADILNDGMKQGLFETPFPLNAWKWWSHIWTLPSTMMSLNSPRNSVLIELRHLSSIWKAPRS